MYFLNHSIQIYTIVCGGLHTLALSNKGKVFSWGCNDEGALGRTSQEGQNPENVPGLVHLDISVKFISAGDSHSMAADDYDVYIWGVYRNTNGGNMSDPLRKPKILDSGNFKNQKITKILSGYNHSLVLANNKIYAWGDPDTFVLGRKPLVRRKFKQSLEVEAIKVKSA